MTTTAARQTRVALALSAYGIELRLWKGPDVRDWGASLRHDNNTIQFKFEEDNLTLAKLHVLGEARNQAMKRTGSLALQDCETFLDAWMPVKMMQA